MRELFKAVVTDLDGVIRHFPISRDEEKGKALVNEALCMGCGTCVATCPSNAIQQAGFEDVQVKSELLALLGEPAELAAV